MFTNICIKSCISNRKRGYTLVVDVKNLEFLQPLHIDILYLPEKGYK